MAWDRPQQAEMICAECPLADCNTESLWCAFRWITGPNITQSMTRARYKDARRKQRKRERLQYFRKRYQERKNAQKNP